MTNRTLRGLRRFYGADTTREDAECLEGVMGATFVGCILGAFLFLASVYGGVK